MSQQTKQGLPIRPFESKTAWREWLDANHDGSEGLWLKIAKKASGIGSVSYSEAVEEALCFGWIDSQKASFNEEYWLQRFTPRRPRSKWSKRNREKARRLIEEGKMKPAGFEQVEEARENGQWEDAYDPQSTITVPDDLQRKLDEHPEAAEFFETLDSANRYAILHRLQTAKKSETRERRLKKYVAMLEAHETIH